MNRPHFVVPAALAAATSLCGQGWTPIAGMPHAVEAGLALDAARGTVVRFGGAPFGNFLGGASLASFGDTWLLQGGRWVRATPAHAPSGRQGTAMAFDPVRQRTVLFGGFSLPGTSSPGGFHNDTWEWDGVDWRQVTTAHAPSPRILPRLVFDNARGETLLFGGSDGPALQDTWYYDGVDWREVVPSTPLPGGLWLAMAYCHNLGKVVGIDTQSNWPRPVETWSFDGTTWAQVPTTTAPPAFGQGTLGPDRQGGLLLLLRPESNPTGALETWQFQGNTWSPVATAQVPGDLAEAPLLWDAPRQRSLALAEDALWEFDGVDWLVTVPATTVPRVSLPALAWDPRRDRLVRFGGFRPNLSVPGWSDEHWEWDGSRWQSVPMAVAPPPRTAARMVYDRRRQCLVLHGGWSQTEWFDTWEHDGVVWQQRFLAHAPTEPVQAMAYDPVRQATIAYAAANQASVPVASTWRYDGSDWSPVPTTAVPPPRYTPPMAWDEARDCAVLFGGQANHGSYADTWEFRDGDWQRQHPQVRPSGPVGQATYDRARGMVVVPTLDSTNLQAVAVWAYDGHLWRRLPEASPVPAIYVYPLTYDPIRERLLLFGPWSELWAYQPAPVAAAARLGDGCSHGTGTAALDLVPGIPPTLGGTLALQATDLPARPGAVWIVFGFGAATWLGAPLPLDLTGIGRPDCRLWLAPSGLGALTLHGGTSATTSLPLPNDPSLAGTTVFAQALVLEPATALGFAGVSNAVVVTPY